MCIVDLQMTDNNIGTGTNACNISISTALMATMFIKLFYTPVIGEEFTFIIEK